MNFETSTEFNGDKVNHEATVQKISSLTFRDKNSKMNFETSIECSSDMVNHEIT
jgi:hypothetical protein